MTTTNSDEISRTRELWEEEILAHHRWGRHGDRALEEQSRLKKLWEVIQPLDEACKIITQQITGLEICNWKLEESILALCKAIGARMPAQLKIGHMASMTDGRWKKVWAYYFSCRNWLAEGMRNGYNVLLQTCDPDGTVQNHVFSMLGDKNELKKLYIERFCLYLEFMIHGCSLRESAPAKAHDSAVLAIEEEITRVDPEGRILNGFRFTAEYYTYAGLELCHHKLFRRYDIILSSIGAGKWRARMPVKGIDGFERAQTVEKCLVPIESWINLDNKTKKKELFDTIYALLGERDDVKVFLASLLVSLLRAQQLFARKIAESRKKKIV